MAQWSITAEPSGYTVRKGRARSAEACDDVEEALHHVRKGFQPGDKVILVERDGYRTVITRQVARKSWRK